MTSAAEPEDHGQDRTAGRGPSRAAAQRSRPPRRHGANLTVAIHRAAIDELVDSGFDELSFDKIAARAGAGKASLYRRWADPAELVLQALTDPATGFGRTPAPHTGSLRADLLDLLGAFARVLDQPHGRALRPLMAQRRRRPELYEQLYRLVIQPHKDLLLEALQAAVDRGEARPGVVNLRMAGVGPRLVVSAHMDDDTVSEQEVEALVDDVLMPMLRAKPGDAGNPVSHPRHRQA